MDSLLMTLNTERPPGAHLWRARPGLTLLTFVALATAPAACRFDVANQSSGSGGTGGTTTGIPGLTALSISPATATLTVTQTGPAQTQQYQVMGTVNGQQEDVTSRVFYVLSPTGIAQISSGGLVTTGNTGGTITVTASAGGQSASATLTIMYTFSGADPMMAGTVPADAATKFTSKTNDASRAPALVYPNDGVLFPPNVSGIEIHFTPGTNNTLFEVSVVGAVSSITSYVRCTTPAGITGCIYQPDPGLWSSIAHSNAGLPPAALTVRGTDDKGTSVGASSTFHIQFSKDAILGGLYYWTTSGSTAIMRWDFGGSTTSAQPYLTQKNTDGHTCVGCHALSLDGTKLVASAGGQNDGRLLLWDVAKNVPKQAFPLMQKSQFESWNAAGTQFVGVYGDTTKKGPGNLMIFDGDSGALAQTIDLGGLRADHPDWSKSSSSTNTIAFTSIDATANTTDQRPAMGGIDFIQDSGSGWGTPQVLVPPQLGKNRYYPAISPDGSLVVFDESTCANTATAGQPADISCDADTDATASVFVSQLPPGSATPVLLANANRPGVADGSNTSLTNSFPKWAPFTVKLDELHKLYWFTFSSTRQYGLRNPPVPANTSESPKGTLIWMVAVKAGINGEDPSFTAFCLPFQDPTTSNHIAQWTKYFIRGPG